ncbi:hypothetical protein CER19_02420 [Pseudomonas sp. GL93]|uniref:hypothetical protein n=1 Tax=unclassified Pseudomonas TaxID=196821 RepID=UPI000E316859|nr:MULTISPECIES: hypothetical protein [unclassified Pseudomonas]RFD33836.1 hypothetical protein CER19_02420 [Pseudomonas sp. GL93]
MSLQQAKKLAEVREQVDAAAKKVGELHEAFRNQINEEVLSNFRSYLEVNDFIVTKTSAGAEGQYKDLKIALVLPGPEERYMGVYHGFDVLIDSKKNDVRILPRFTGMPERPLVRSGDATRLLEEDLRLLNEEAKNAKLASYKFECTQKGSGPNKSVLTKETVAEVIDYFSA